MEAGARQVAESVARASYGRLLAYLAARACDVAAAEDALADAFHAALRAWPERGIPDSPEAWLFTAAKRRLIHAARHAMVRTAAEAVVTMLAEEGAESVTDEFPDDRLKLLFVCAHPAIDAAVRAPLMLQTVLGLDAARIASAFLVAPATMAQRLVRAKSRIREAGIGFSIPEPAALPERLDAVLAAIYAAYGSGWDDVAGADPRRRGLTEEAIWLARLVVGLLPDEPEARGLLALMLHCEARRPARRSPDGAFVPLLEQEPALWSQPMIDEAEAALSRAASAADIGRFQLEAAIQSAHAQRRTSGSTPWASIALLYRGLVAISPVAGALVGQAAAGAEAEGPVEALRMLDRIPPATVLDYQPYWALRGHLLRRMGDQAGAREAYGRSIGLTEDPAVRAFLLGRIAPGS